MFEACFSHLMNTDFDSVWDLVRTRESARSLARVARRGGFGSLGRAAERYISDDELRKVFSFQALYAGVPPKKARAVYATISHMDTGMGVFYPTRGPHGSGVGALCDILAAALKQSGGELMLNTRVTSLSHASHGAGSFTTHSDRIHVVETTQGTLPADVVITTCDIPEQFPVRSHATGLVGITPSHSERSGIVHFRRSRLLTVVAASCPIRRSWLLVLPVQHRI